MRVIEPQITIRLTANGHIFLGEFDAVAAAGIGSQHN